MSGVPAPPPPPADPNVGAFGDVALDTGDGAAQIFERGYRRYDGERLGRAAAIRAVWAHAFQRILGMRRPVWAKILPILVVFISYVPAIVFVGIVAFAKNDPSIASSLPRVASCLSRVASKASSGQSKLNSARSKLDSGQSKADSGQSKEEVRPPTHPLEVRTACVSYDLRAGGNLPWPLRHPPGPSAAVQAARTPPAWTSMSYASYG